MANTFADISFINFDAFTNTPVCRLIDVKGKQWDNANDVLDMAPTYADTVITLAENTAINGVPLQIPLLVPSGKYHLMFYDNAAPDNTTAYSRWYMIDWASDAREITCIRDMGSMA